MKQGWQIKILGEVCDIYQPTTISAKDLVENGKYLVYGANGIIGRYNQYNHENSEVLLTCRGNTCGTINVSEPFAWINGNAMVVRPKGNVLLKSFLRYCLMSIDYSKVITGAAQPQITRMSLAPTLIAFPSSLSEQQRIVALLDAEFAKIDALKANAEKNLQNAKDLFQAALKKELEPKKGWFVSTLRQMLKLTSGDNLTAKSIVEGVYPVYGGNGIMGYHNQYNLDGENVIVGRVGALCGNVRFVKGKIWYTDNAFLVNDKTKSFYLPFLTYELTKADLRQYATQAAQPVISNVSMKDVVLSIPPTINDQQTIVARLDVLSEKCKTLQSNYEKTLSLCDDLKQALLRKAFNGEI